MVVINKIYTKTGDAGETALGDGRRVKKHSERVIAYGTVDELNATVGVARLHAQDDVDAALSRIQNDLFDLGADLCKPDMDKDDQAEYPPLRMQAEQTSRLEEEIDAMLFTKADDGEIIERLEPLRSFILPAGTPLSTQLHVCRTVARRAERLTVELSESEHVNPAAITYLNRLSDWFFAAARFANNKGKSDVLWVPGANR